jgi:predicted transcriptional regulator
MMLLNEPVEKFARKALFYVDENATVSDAVRVMKENQAISAFIKKEGRVVGILTYKDIIFRVIGEGLNPAQVKVASVMSSPVLSVKVGDSIGNALDMMSKHNIRRLLVVDESGAPYGILVEKQVDGDLIESSQKTWACGVKQKSWLERHILEVSEDVIQSRH